MHGRPVVTHTPEQVAEARAAWDRREHRAVVAAILGISSMTLYVRAAAWGWPARPRSLRDWEDGRRRWDAGESSAAIGRALGCSDQTVRWYAMRHGWPSRDTHESRVRAARTANATRWGTRRVVVPGEPRRVVLSSPTPAEIVGSVPEVMVPVRVRGQLAPGHVICPACFAATPTSRAWCSCGRPTRPAA